MKKVLVTGGSRGIGKAIADRFVGNGCDVTIACTGMPTLPYYDDREVRTVDFTSDRSTSMFVDHVVRGGYDIVVNNAGINIIEPLDDIMHEDFERVQKVNLHAPFRVSQAAAKSMVRKGWGRIVNIASIWSVVTKAGRVSYTTSKSGLVGMTRTMAVELAPFDVVVNSVSPGFTMTDLTRDSLTGEQIRDLALQVPMGRFADPDEIAQLVLFLCSVDNTYIVGQNIVIDGGFTNV